MSKKLKRTGTIEINTPLYAKNIARYAIESAKETEKNRTYSLITARVFTAFMVEGALDCLGRILCSEWDENGKESLSWSPAKEKNKAIRTIIGLTNDGKKYHFIAPLVEFRHGLAHPKLMHFKFEEEIESELQDSLPTKWEKELTLEKVEKEHTEAVQYCDDLFDKATTFLKKELEENKVEFFKKYKYKHISNTYNPIDQLQSFWHKSKMVNASLTLE